MALNIGRKGWVGAGLESSYGVPVAVQDYVPFLENSLRGRHEPIPNEAAYGVREKRNTSYAGKKWSEGDVSINLDSKLSGYFLVAGLGSVSSSSLGSSVYDHTISRNNSNTPQSLTIINDRVTDREYFPGVAVSQLEFSVSDALATIKASLVGKFPITSTSGSLTTASGSVFSFKDTFFAFGSTVAAAAASSNIKNHDSKFTFNNNTKPVHRHGSGDADTVNHGEIEEEFEGTLYFENTTQRDLYYNTSKKAAVLKFTGLGVGGGFQETLTINMYQIGLDNWELETGLADFFAEKYTGALEYDNANSKSLDMVLRNTKSSYI